MKRELFKAAILVGIVLSHIGCDDGEKRSLVNTADTQSTLPMPAITPADNQQPAVLNTQPASTPATTAGAGVALNPKHGQPGHRCDLAVGAPLNQAAAPATQPIVSQQPAAPVSNAQPLNLSNLPLNQSGGTTGLNPKHGEPGHRCDIAVGAPLNKPATSTQTIPAPQQPASPAAQALNLSSTSVTPTQGSGVVALNPKHGEPGHRCDLKVGAPLNSQPAATSQPATAIGTTPMVLPNTATPAATASTPSTLPLPSMQLPKLNTSASGKLNPKHGEPGHRCDLAVGAPLK